MKKTIKDFINSIDTKLYSQLRGSISDAECRRYLKEHLQKQLTIYSVSKSVNCEHTGDEILHQGNGFIYKTCADCGEDI